MDSTEPSNIVNTLVDSGKIIRTGYWLLGGLTFLPFLTLFSVIMSSDLLSINFYTSLNLWPSNVVLWITIDVGTLVGVAILHGFAVHIESKLKKIGKTNVFLVPVSWAALIIIWESFILFSNYEGGHIPLLANLILLYSIIIITRQIDKYIINKS